MPITLSALLSSAYSWVTSQQIDLETTLLWNLQCRYYLYVFLCHNKLVECDFLIAQCVIVFYYLNICFWSRIRTWGIKRFSFFIHYMAAGIVRVVYWLYLQLLRYIRSWCLQFSACLLLASALLTWKCKTNIYNQSWHTDTQTRTANDPSVFTITEKAPTSC